MHPKAFESELRKRGIGYESKKKMNGDVVGWVHADIVFGDCTM